MLWPKGAKTIDDLPAKLVMAIDHALKVLSWYENLEKSEIPPQWMWHLDWELSDWWEQVDRERKAKYGRPDDDDDRESVLAEREENEYAARFK